HFPQFSFSASAPLLTNNGTSPEHQPTPPQYTLAREPEIAPLRPPATQVHRRAAPNPMKSWEKSAPRVSLALALGDAYIPAP
ncbi:MAG TPA: hypothetical protein PLH23_08150, partial [Hyphomonadaceae bacterium]|nr:hypothetical protein [Hyphomonadaceae bacterium]HPI48224.1 hypothetical protein [Hyphomonadaceae bacterium]